ncbi:UNVERIFIED_CONTAM: hypothetical protein FKN15_061852, partial [Acipenser sinensis]
QALDRTIAKDERLAVGFFQRGAVHMLAGRLEEALSDCSLALKHFRGNSVIDYRQLGLRYQLHSWQVTLYTLPTHWASNAAASRGATVVMARLIYRHI